MAADLVAVADDGSTVVVLGSDGFVGVRENDVWSSSGSTPITSSDLAETFTPAIGDEASELSSAARAALSS